MLLSDLEVKVKEYIQTEKLNSFRDVTGWQLNDFITKNKDKFDVFSRKQRKFIKVRLKQKKKSSSPRGDGAKCIEDSGHQTSEITSQGNSDDDRKDCQNSGDNSWSKVMYKKGNRRKSHTVPPLDMTKEKRLSPTHDTIKDMNYNSNVPETSEVHEKQRVKTLIPWSPERFEALVKHGEKRDIMFVTSVDEYISSPIRLSRDIVSMWNTPHRSKSYIIIGMAKDRVIGVQSDYGQIKYENLFQEEYFSRKPMFKSFAVDYKSKLVHIIEVASSQGYGSPCIVEKHYESTESVSLHKMEVWVRKSKSNVLCDSDDLPDIYKWFSDNSLGSSTGLSNEGASIKKNKTHYSTNSQNKNSCLEHLCSENVENQQSPGNSFNFFWDAVKGFQKGHFVLVAGDVSCDRRHLQALSKVPWISVYDFDVFSYAEGLLNALHDSVKTERHLSISCWNEPAEGISEQGTRWCFMRGRNEMSSSRTNLDDGTIEDTTIWFQLVKKGLQNYCHMLASFAEDYTVLTIVFLWPKTEQLAAFMVKFLSRLMDTLTSTPNLVLCMPRDPETSSGRLKYENLRDDYRTVLSVCHLAYEEMCIGIRDELAEKSKKSNSYDLPKNEQHESSGISETDASWLREDFEVLFLNSPYDTTDRAADDILNELNLFRKGASLPWSTWYSGDAEETVIGRTIEKELADKISRQLEDYKTSIVTLCHAPGSGGTTLAQKTLWHFHRRTPCVHLKLRTVSNVEELGRKVCFLYEKTDLPVLLLIDGEEESKVRWLSRQLKYTVILYIKRYPYKIQSSTEHDRAYMSGIVSATESVGLETKLGALCSDERKKERLREMTTEVKKGTSNHFMYEYGLTVYLHEFNGVVSYVQGYLELDKNPTRELFPSQKCLGFLALVYYYGQSCVPCQFFSAMFNKLPNYNMTLEDFPPLVREFVVHDRNEGRRNNIRICHYIIAKEILEQILSRHGQKTTERTEAIGKTACHNLSKFCMEFIEYACCKKTKVRTLSTATHFILTKTFIFRDEKDMSDNEEQVRKKPVLSKLMIDIPGGRPLFTERLRVLQKLTDSFPDDPNFCAHLGRFYAFCRPDEEIEAEKCFQKAINMCQSQMRGKRDEDIEDGMKLTMMHIYHMYGIMKQRCISKYTDRMNKERKVTDNNDYHFYEILEELVPVVETACEYFKRSRDVTPDSHHVYTYAYTGEIQSRLQLCDFVNLYFKKGCQRNNGIVLFLNSSADPRLKALVQKSFSAIENLIFECYTDVILIDRDVQSLRKYVAWYNTLFQKQLIPLDTFCTNNRVDDRRHKIRIKTKNYGKGSSTINSIENIDDETDLEMVVNWYEENFNDIRDYGFQAENGDEKTELERDYRNWLFAIRLDKFKKDYSLEEVLNYVQFWHDKLGSPYSTFNLFILKSLLGFGTLKTPGKTECLIEALECRERLAKVNHLVIKPKYPREWLGNEGEGIKRLKPGNRYVGLCTEDREAANTRLDLMLCRGTICRPNTNKVNGMIALDLAAHLPEVRVYFIPKIVRLEGTRFAGERVEFYLAFSFQHGYEAYRVKVLRRYGCGNCGRNIEFNSIETHRHCKCGRTVQRDDMNEVK